VRGAGKGAGKQSERAQTLQIKGGKEKKRIDRARASKLVRNHITGQWKGFYTSQVLKGVKGFEREDEDVHRREKRANKIGRKKDWPEPKKDRGAKNPGRGREEDA